MNIDLRGLGHVAALARLLSFTKAAEEIGISQSALSRSIQSIERRAKVRLFDRDRGGGVHLTMVGKVFAERANAVLRQAGDLNDLLRRSASGDAQVAFGIAPLPATALLPDALVDGASSCLQLCKFVAVRSIEALLPMLLAEEIEFLICAEQPMLERPQVRGDFLGWFPVSLMARKGHPLLNPRATARKDAYPLVISGRIDESRQIPAQLRFRLQPPIVIEDYGILARLTATSDAIWLGSSFAVSETLATGALVELPHQNPSRMRMMLYTLDRRTLSPAALRLKTRFREQISLRWRKVKQ